MADRAVLRLEGRRPFLPQQAQMRLRYLLIPLTIAVVCATTLVARAQVALPSIGPAPSSNAPVRHGAFLVAPINIDGVPIFRIAELVSSQAGSIPIDTRRLLVHDAVRQILATNPNGSTVFDPKSLSIADVREGSQYVLQATDKTHTDPIPIVTVTTPDAQYMAMPDAALAQLWKTQLQPALVAALVRRQPAQIRENQQTIARAAALGAIVTIVLLAVAGLIRERLRALAIALLWLLVLSWAAAATWALLQFPQTVVFGQQIVNTTRNLIVIWVAAWIVDRMLGISIERAAIAYARRTATGEDRQRHLLRAPTISRALGGFKTFAVIFISLLATLSALTIPIASVVTIGGIAALAIGFAAQTLVKDWLNGMFVLFEDQYVIGDFVMIGDYNGIVESLSLRMVQLRDARGNLVTIPHSSVTQVVNASRTWSRVDYRIAVDAESDVKAAIGTLRSTMEQLSHDDAWRGAIFEPVETIGVELLSKPGIVLRATMRCAPLRQYELRRELNLRVKDAFAHTGIALGIDPNDAKTIGQAVSPSPA